MKKGEKSVTNNLKEENFLTRKKYVRLLRIIGLSAKPLSSYEIKQEYKAEYKNTIDEDEEISNSKTPPKNPDNYIYKMIHQLTPDLIDDCYEYGFNWNEIIENNSQQKRVLNYILKYFKIDLKESDNNFEKLSNNPLFSKSKDDKIIKIENQSKHRAVTIEKTRYSAEVILNENNDKKILSLKVKDDTDIYFPTIRFRESFDSVINILYRRRPYFLDISYKTKIKKIELKDKQVIKDNYFQEVTSYENKTIDVITKDGYTLRKPLKDYLPKSTYEFMQNSQPQYETEEQKVESIKKYYSLNIRGLIIYILGELNSSQNDSTKNKSKYSKNRYYKNISKVLENLSQNYSSNFPFLYNYKKFREIFEDVTKIKNLRYYEVEVLITIAKELKKQILFDERFSNRNLYSNNDTLINFWITKRYLSEIYYYYFVYLYPFLENDNKKNEFIHLFRDYQKRMLMLMEEYLEKEQKSVRNLLDEFNRKNLRI